ncbi:hypothetical protein L2E82_36302 [Cichorium intybus]|uniref:Uncharacterized protein n=1 Tax=Cichorium intybus TaxID=13427 RepID=A0ACB9BR57_CICIN|nr:hypothetical protein L2E82_36302 [Cichorium intybus]
MQFGISFSARCTCCQFGKEHKMVRQVYLLWYQDSCSRFLQCAVSIKGINGRKGHTKWDGWRMQTYRKDEGDRDIVKSCPIFYLHVSLP